MPLSDYWNALTSQQRAGLVTGTVVLAVATAGLAAWVLQDPMVSLGADLEADHLEEIEQQLDHAKVAYRIADDGGAVLVARSQLGKARASIDGHVGAPPAVGLELFKDTDFSSTDFAQRINYQRALQGELTRTIETIAGVRSARVHVILPEAGLLKRESTKASAAVSVTMRTHQVLSASQVQGIQRLVAASVPQIGVQDVVVLDDSGRSLTRLGGTDDGPSELSSAQLDRKREADQYLETKVIRLLQDAAPQAVVSASVDTVLDERRVQVTTDEPIGHRKLKDGDAETGVLLKERQSEHGRTSGAADSDAGGDLNEHEYEYQVGHRMEQALSAPGSIRHLSVAVLVQGAPAELSREGVEQLVATAIGVDRSRGDAVSVLLLPAAAAGTTSPGTALPVAGRPSQAPAHSSIVRYGWAWLILAGLTTLTILVFARRRRPEPLARLPPQTIDLDAATHKVRQWLLEGSTHGNH